MGSRRWRQLRTIYNTLPQRRQENAELPFSKSGNSLELTWSFDHLVSSANLAAGPWLPVSGAISPQLVAPTGAPRFYRTVLP